jgi:hypothetical protein
VHLGAWLAIAIATAGGVQMHPILLERLQQATHAKREGSELERCRAHRQKQYSINLKNSSY